jgi:hypothetical protein
MLWLTSSCSILPCGASLCWLSHNAEFQYAVCCYAECHYAKFYFADCRCSLNHTGSIIMLNFVVLSVFMLNFVILNVIMQNFDMLSVFMFNFFMLNVIMQNFIVLRSLC